MKKNIPGLLLLIIIGFVACDQKDPCLNLPACEQYQCLNPDFYCGQTFYESNTAPKTIKDARIIVMDYINNQLKMTAEITLSTKMKEPYYWFQITCNLSNGDEYGYEVGPDGNIYEIKRMN